MNHAAYLEFLRHCQKFQNLTVRAGNNHPREANPKSIAYYSYINSCHSIWVRREAGDHEIHFKSKSDKLDNFISKSEGLPRELSLLSHEYGHYKLGHNYNNTRKTREDCLDEFNQEIAAWDEGKNVLTQFNVSDWDVFESVRKNSLDCYFDGFTNLFPEFPKTVTYRREP